MAFLMFCGVGILFGALSSTLISGSASCGFLDCLACPATRAVMPDPDLIVLFPFCCFRTSPSPSVHCRVASSCPQGGVAPSIRKYRQLYEVFLFLGIIFRTMAISGRSVLVRMM